MVQIGDKEFIEISELADSIFNGGETVAKDNVVVPEQYTKEWNAAVFLGEPACKVLRDFIAKLRAAESQLAASKSNFKKLDNILDEEGCARSCINPFEDLRIALRGTKAELAALRTEFDTILAENMILRGEVKRLNEIIQPPKRLTMQKAGFHARYASDNIFIICSAVDHLIHGKGATELEAWTDCIEKKKEAVSQQNKCNHDFDVICFNCTNYHRSNND